MTMRNPFATTDTDRGPQGISQMQSEFHITQEPIVVLGVTTYLLGIAVGSLLLAPLSETYGRKWVYCINMALFVLFVLPCAKATSMAVSNPFDHLRNYSIARHDVDLAPSTNADLFHRR
jgi:MFS family permease